VPYYFLVNSLANLVAVCAVFLFFVSCSLLYVLLLRSVEFKKPCRPPDIAPNREPATGLLLENNEFNPPEAAPPKALEPTSPKELLVAFPSQLPAEPAAVLNAAAFSAFSKLPVLA
jgi:hypothetical protein